MRVPPMIASLARHKLTVLLMLFATAFTYAIVTNIAPLIAWRMASVREPSGLAESSVVLFHSNLIQPGQTGSVHHHRNFLPQYTADVKALRGIDGVQAAAMVRGLPMQGSSGTGFSANPGAPPGAAVNASVYIGGPGELESLGLRLLSGRDFTRSEYVALGQGKPAATIVTRALAERLFHTPDAVGRLLYPPDQDHPMRVVGVVAHLMGTASELGFNPRYSILEPVEPDGAGVTFVLRTTPERRVRVLSEAVKLASRRHPDRVTSGAVTFAQLRAQHFRRYRSMIGLLAATGIGLLLVTAAGIAGLSSFWVQQRIRSIGIRRALGATRADILRYTHLENFLIVTAGIVLGCALSYGLNALLMEYYAVEVLPPTYLLVGAVALWLMGQLAALVPSLRAGAVPPAVATRTV